MATAHGEGGGVVPAVAGQRRWFTFGRGRCTRAITRPRGSHDTVAPSLAGGRDGGETRDSHVRDGRGLPVVRLVRVEDDVHRGTRWMSYSMHACRATRGPDVRRDQYEPQRFHQVRSAISRRRNLRQTALAVAKAEGCVYVLVWRVSGPISDPLQRVQNGSSMCSSAPLNRCSVGRRQVHAGSMQPRVQPIRARWWHRAQCHQEAQKHAR